MPPLKSGANPVQTAPSPKKERPAISLRSQDFFGCGSWKPQTVDDPLHDLKWEYCPVGGWFIARLGLAHVSATMIESSLEGRCLGAIISVSTDLAGSVANIRSPLFHSNRPFGKLANAPSMALHSDMPLSRPQSRGREQDVDREIGGATGRAICTCGLPSAVG